MMRTVDEIERDLKERAFKECQMKLKTAREEAIKLHIIDTICSRITTYMPGCIVSNYGYSTHVTLTEDFNIHDWYLVLEEIEPLIDLLEEGEYTTREDYTVNSIDFVWDRLRIYVYFGNGKCERVKVGSKTRTITE